MCALLAHGCKLCMILDAAALFKGGSEQLAVGRLLGLIFGVIFETMMFTIGVFLFFIFYFEGGRIRSILFSDIALI